MTTTSASLSLPRTSSSFEKSFTFGDQRGKFTLKSTTKDRTAYTASTKLKGHSSHNASINWNGIPVKEFHETSSFQIRMEVKGKDPHKFQVDISRVLPKTPPEGSSSSQTSSTQKQASSLHFILTDNVRELVAAVKKKDDSVVDKKTDVSQDQLVEMLINKMITSFDKKKTHIKKYNREMIGLLPIMTQEQRFALVSQFVNTIKASVLHAKGALEAIRDILYSFQREDFKRRVKHSILDEEKEELCLPPLSEVLNAEQLLKVASLLKEKALEKSDASSNNAEGQNEHIWALEALIAVLVGMRTNGVKGVERTTFHDPLYKTLDEFELRGGLRECYLAALGKQILVNIADDETKLHAFFRHAYQVVQGCFNLYQAYDKKSLKAVGDAMHNFVEASTFQQLKADWYKTLFSVEYAIATLGGKYLNSLKELVGAYDNLGCQDAKQALNEMHTHNPIFLMGFVGCLKDFLNDEAADLEACETALWLLERICMANIDKKKEFFHVYLKADTKLKKAIFNDLPDIITKGRTEKETENFIQQLVQELIQEIRSSLHFYATSHPNAAVRKIAEESASTINKKIYPSQDFAIPKFKYESFPNELFLANVNEVAPYRSTLQQERTRLDEDTQLKKESLYYVNVRVESAWGKLDMHDAINKFLESDYTSMLVTGTSGTGKTSSMKQFAKQLWQQEGLWGFIPIFISLSTVNDPCKAIEETLHKYDSSISLTQLQKQKDIKFLFIFDAVDETPLGAKVHLYTRNELALWKGSKVIFTCRSDQFDPDDSKAFYEDRKHFIRIDTLPFQDTQRKEYLTKFLKYLQTEGVNPKWGVDEYMTFIDRNEKLKEVISIPLYLYLTAETLPGIVELSKKEGESQDDQITENNLLGAFFCLMIEREIYKKFNGRGAPFDKEEELKKYLKYALNVASTIHNYELEHKDGSGKGVPWIPAKTAKKAHPELFNFAKEEVYSASRCCSISTRDGKIGFLHEAFYSFFLQMAMNNVEKSILKERLLEGKYGFDQMLSNSQTIY